MNIQIPTIEYDKIMHWINKTDIEVSGFGSMVYDKNTDTFRVLKAYILKQQGGAAHTDIDAQALAKLEYDTRNDEGEIRWWWHSHVNMAVFWSSTDTETIESMGKHGWMTATVFNKKREYKSAISYKSTADFNDLIHHNPDIPTTIGTMPTASDQEQWDAEFTANVQEKNYTPQAYHSTYLGQQWSEEEYRFNSTAEKEFESHKKKKQEEVESFADWEPGLMGYGLRVEAKAVGMKYRNYKMLLESGDAALILGIEQQLEQAMMQGELI